MFLRFICKAQTVTLCFKQSDNNVALLLAFFYGGYLGSVVLAYKDVRTWKEPYLYNFFFCVLGSVEIILVFKKIVKVCGTGLVTTLN